MPKIDVEAVPLTNRTGYPAPFAEAVAGRFVRRLGPASGLSEFGASHVTLEPGAASSQRHWHEAEDELVVMLAGEAVLIDDRGRTVMRPGDVAAFPKNDGNGHHLVNESGRPCTFVAIGRVPEGVAHYPDIDLVFDGPTGRYLHKDGTPY
ncbi:cupin domain-containing protein [Sphingomonas quercus]|uniref:Cupin domain-containing protein n=1 Tax=Sphingomonas quercus TaxID=2842451 RepID=A0ABS6BNX7_9SPHN|nr:cupin domain-containing protein [Sphingomonas quercus]MBU3079101.1 cupin domain-containing protein [Sphingomonas quercus]